MSSSIANGFSTVTDFLRDTLHLTSSNPLLSSPSKSHESPKSYPPAQMSGIARGAPGGSLSISQIITVEDEVEEEEKEDDKGEYDPAPTSSRVRQLMATRSGNTTSRRITPSKSERESRRSKSYELEKDVTRLLGGISEYGQVNRGDADTDSRHSRQQDQGATAITIPGSKPTYNTQRPKQSSYGGFSGGRNNLYQSGPLPRSHDSPSGVALGKLSHTKPSSKALQTRTSTDSNVAQSRLGSNNHIDGPPKKKRRTTTARQAPIEIEDEDAASSILAVTRINEMAQENSTTTIHNRQPSHSSKVPQLAEYRGIEGLVDPSPRGRGRGNRSMQAGERDPTDSLIDLSLSNEALNPTSTIAGVRKNRLKSESANQKVSPYFTNPGHSANGDHRKESAQSLPNMNEKESNLRHKFVSTDGKRGNSTTQQNSDDELNGPATVPTRIRGPSTTNSSEDTEMLDNPAPTREIAPSNIKRTNFNASPKKTSLSEPPRKRAKRTSEDEFAIEYLRLEECRIDAEHEGSIVIQYPEETLEFFAAKSAFPDSILEFSIGTIKGIDHGDDPSKKLRLKLRIIGSGAMRIKFESHKRMMDFIRNLQSIIPEVKVNNRASEWMDKAFHNDETLRGTRLSNKSSVFTERPKVRRDIPLANESRRHTKLIDALRDEGGRPSNRLASVAPKQTIITGRDRAGDDLDIHDTLESSERRARLGLPHSSTRTTRSASKKDDALSPIMASLNQPNIDLGPRWKKALVFPKDAKKTTHVEFSDMERLREHEFLNDNLIEFYTRYLQHYLEQDRPEVASTIYFFNTFFYERLTKDKKGSVVNFNAVAKWTSKVDLFGYDFVVVPINESAHWYLAIICNLRGLERKIASTKSAESESEDQAVEKDEKDEDTKESKPRSIEPRGADERLPLNLGAEAEESNEDARESFASLTLGEEGKYSITKEAKPDDEEKDWPSEGENGESHSKEMTDSTKEVNLAKDTAPTSSPAKSLRASPTAKRGRKSKRKSFGPKYDPEIPAIITLDSLIIQRGATIKTLKEYLREEAKAKRSMKVEDKDLQGINAKGIPTQQNFSDCGLFLLAYLEMFLKDPKEFVAKIMRREMSEAEWPPTTGYDLRERLRKMIQRLHDEQQDKKIPNKEEDKLKRDTCEEGFTLLGPKKEPSPEPADIDSSPERTDHPSYAPTLPKNVSFFDAKIRSRFHDPKKRESIDPISLEADDQSPKMANKTKIQVQNSQDEVPESVDPYNLLAQQLACTAKSAVDSEDEVVEIQQESRSSSRTQRRNSVDTDFVRDPNRSYELALQTEQLKHKDAVDLDKILGRKFNGVQSSHGRGRKSHH